MPDLAGPARPAAGWCGTATAGIRPLAPPAPRQPVAASARPATGPDARYWDCRRMTWPPPRVSGSALPLHAIQGRAATRPPARYSYHQARIVLPTGRVTPAAGGGKDAI